MSTKKKNEVVVSPSAAVALPYDYGDYAGQGMDLTLDDLKIPFISLVQNDSKVLDKDEESFIPGGKAGDLVNAATKTYNESLLIVPAVRKLSYVEWLPDRGGFVAEHEPTSAIVREAQSRAASRNELKTAAGNELQETKSLFSVACDPDTLAPVGVVVVPFTASKMGPWRDYFTALDTAKVTKNSPLFAHLVRLTSFDAKSKAGKKFKNYSMFAARDDAGNLTMDPLQANIVTSMIGPDTEAFQAAVQLAEAVNQGRASADQTTAAEGTTGKAEEGGDQHF